MLTLIQLSDCHLFKDPKTLDPKFGFCEQSFDRVLEDIKVHYPKIDGIILSGDLAQEPTKKAYQRCADKLQSLDAPVMAVPGNHDDKIFLTEVFDQSELSFDHWQVIGLDSAHPGKFPYSGLLGKPQLDVLAQRLEGDQRPAILVLHHPALLFADTWIKEAIIDDSREFERLVMQCPHIKAVSWGHIHQAVTIEHLERLWLSNPSTSVQYNILAEQFALDRQKRVGYRALLCETNGRLTTDVHWVVGG